MRDRIVVEYRKPNLKFRLGLARSLRHQPPPAAHTDRKPLHPMFEDRRKSTDRRVRRDPAAIPTAGCRRQDDRRDRKRRYQPHPWWLMANYSEEVQPPELKGDPEDQDECQSPSDWLSRLRRRRRGAVE